MKLQGTPTDTNVIKSHLPPSKSYRSKRTLRNDKEQWKRTSAQSKHLDLKVSQMSNKKWQIQEWQFITNWTSQQMDAYLAILPEVALDWNVEPG
jgi:hypothetical protein